MIDTLRGVVLCRGDRYAEIVVRTCARRRIPLVPWPAFESPKAHAIARRWVDGLDGEESLRERFARELHKQAGKRYAELLEDEGKRRRVIDSR
jgi:hypothetical protein